MNSKNKVSIIVPVYNAEKFISNTIESILCQSYKNIELVLVNDGSTDDSLAVCQNFADSRINILSIKNSGPSNARNRALEIVTGQYIMFVDADDSIEPEMVEVMVSLIENSELAMCSYTSIFKDRTIKRVAKTYNGSTDYLWSHYSDLYKNLLIQYIWNKIYRLEIIKKNNLAFDSNIRRGEDILFNLEYFKHINQVSITDATLYNYIRYNENSITLVYNLNMFVEQKFLFNTIRKTLIAMNAYEKNKKILGELYTDRIIMSIKNLYLEGCHLNKADKLDEIKRIIGDSHFRESIKESQSKNWRHVILKILILMKNARLIQFFYNLRSSRS